MHLHILGVCGTFMGGIAALASALGHRVSGSDQNVYPPMSTQLEQLGITLNQGYSAEALQPAPDVVVIGNALSRGNAAVEYVLNQGLNYCSGPQWLAENVLRERQVIAVAGTHGKTTTSALIAWLLEESGFNPGFLIGGVPGNFDCSARLGKGKVFVVEADEYDTAFFDKRSKFVHYRPEVAVLNNLEFDHADIFPDLAAIERQFHHLLRTVPGRGRVISQHGDAALERVLAQGCWTPVEHFSPDSNTGCRWRAELLQPDASAFRVFRDDELLGETAWKCVGRHNLANALAAIAAVSAVGADPRRAVQALNGFIAPRRRLEQLADIDDVRVFDDFAHHPTAIATTLAGMRAAEPNARLIVAMEPRSNSMRMGAHAAALPASLADADKALLLKRPETVWDTAPLLTALGDRAETVSDVDTLIARLSALAQPGDRIVFMSNGGFDAAPTRMVEAIRSRSPSKSE